MITEHRLDTLKETLVNLRRAEDGLYRAMDAFETIDWIDDIREPHHVMMEMEDVLCQVMKRIEEIEEKVSRI